MGIFDKIKDMNEMRKEASRMQALLSQHTVTGGDKIKITIDGNYEVKSVEVSDDVVGDRGTIAREIRKSLEEVSKNYKKKLQSEFGSMLAQ